MAVREMLDMVILSLQKKERVTAILINTLINVNVPYTVVYNFSINCFHSPNLNFHSLMPAGILIVIWMLH